MRSFFAALAVIAGTLVPAVTAPPVFAAASAPAQTPARAPSAGIGIRLIDAPTDAKDDPRAHVYIVDHLNPAAVIHRRIELSNRTSTPVQVSLYAAAADVTGGSFVGAAGHTPNELSSWTSTQPGLVDLPAGGTQMATVTVSVPRDAAPGERYGAVWAEIRSRPGHGAGVTQISRVGIRLYIDVGPGGPPAAAFTIDRLTAARTPGGQPTVSAAVHNTGGRAIDLAGTIQLDHGPGGLSAGPFPIKLGTTVGIGDTESAAAVLDAALPAGPWNARITLRSGLTEVSVAGTITFPAAGRASSVAVAPIPAGDGRHRWMLPTFLILGAVALLTVLLLSLRVRRRRRSVKGASGRVSTHQDQGLTDDGVADSGAGEHDSQPVLPPA
ncbi:hypothetical protein SAMN04515671_0149 [Nakamurella panacisegetis]|uniref:DUF916 domain-containing protein n=1 Tax=Nakamurella panacisegetis TaxID=1090615 RepID=A0A1H0HP71_9ACTN|nr:hypothetical protein [Nakamurella panacisegetis]SDO20894.1 hypothetical protein SAMN04515671_0149 [Nakamurella panacisegetis]